MVSIQRLLGSCGSRLVIVHCLFSAVFASCPTIEHYYFDYEEQSCPDFVDPRLLQNGIQVGQGEPFRAYRTLPDGFRIMQSSIPQAGLGVFATTFIPKYTWLGEYEGEFLPKNFSRMVYVTEDGEIANDWDYSWEIHSKGIQVYHVDAIDVKQSNWLRFLNCATSSNNENVQSLECFGRVYYITLKDIHPGQELLVFYGTDYAINLGIPLNENDELMDESEIEEYEEGKDEEDEEEEEEDYEYWEHYNLGYSDDFFQSVGGFVRLTEL